MEYSEGLLRTLSHTSTQSISTTGTSFDAKWMPESTVLNQTRYKVSLKVSKEEGALLQKTWKNVISNSDTSNVQTSFTSSVFCVQFYNNLIRMMPGVEKLIPSLKHQASAFAGVINVAMSTLDDLSRMDESLERLGRLHSRILGIDAELFEIMGQALITTFRDRYANFGREEEECWSKLYCFLANSILQGGIDPVIEYSSTYAETREELISQQSIYESDEEAEDSVYDYLDFAGVSANKKNSTPKVSRSSASSQKTFVPSPGAYMTPRNSVSSAQSPQTLVNRSPAQQQRYNHPSPSSLAGMANIPSGIMHPPPQKVASLAPAKTQQSLKSSKRLSRRGKKAVGEEDPNCIIM
ncbi:unnamed protein product [Kuraishia capsulata CBS 1993]|uniref:Globin domain-containing protein n=1 Tax=Kuraishia capsulata CBS 1993 TaxID=1382522 RepID=W6MMR9_9ASCO|nr:uncharacterized protein KUCA_T00003889001 [Kuraishia capsulata CBS 1993]CDK27909.1 unnamed protein product [Kuraishia capsulata CBS 1993]